MGEFDQLNLFNDLDDNNQLKKETNTPRGKNIPSELKEKQTNASASAFGWKFQISSSIILSLKNIKTLDKISVEGNTEDIELYFNDKEPIYIQAKAVQNTPEVKKDSQKIAAALNTLINTSNITRGKYSELVIIVNLTNPLNLNKNDLNSSWIPKMDELFEKTYKSLPDSGKEYLKKRFKTALSSLKSHNHKCTHKYFDFNNLTIITYIFSSNDKESTQYATISKKLSEFLINDCKLNNHYLNKVSSIIDMFVRQYLDLAGSKKKYSMRKIEIIFKIISCLMTEPSENFSKLIPYDVDDELSDYKSYVLSKQSNKISNINAILKGYNNYCRKCTSLNILSNNNEKVDKFIEEKYIDYENLFPLDDNHSDEEREWGTKYIMRTIIDSRRMISKVKKGADLI